METARSLMLCTIVLFITAIPLAHAQSEILIDTHSHLTPAYEDEDPCTPTDVIPCSLRSPIDEALRWMRRYAVSRTILMSQPLTGDPAGPPECRHYSRLSTLLLPYADKFSFSGGGASLNKMLQANSNPAQITIAEMQAFRLAAWEIVLHGAVGYGELAIDHLSLNQHHPYEHVPANHPFLMILTKYSAVYGMPISVHMEAIRSNIPLPSELAQYPQNPPQLLENIRGFERLLAANRGANIIWLHAGWDNTGHRSVALMSYLLRKHPNLYIDLKLRRNKLNTAPNHPLDENWVLKPEWVTFIEEFRDRIMIGQDQHYLNNTGPGAAAKMRALIAQLPSDTRKLVTSGNALRIFTRVQ